MDLHLYNSLTKTKEPFVSQHKKTVTLYTCGPTVYNYAHIGNLRTYVFEDILKRSLQFFGYTPLHGMNITDVGHMSDDGDEGEDKIEKGALKEGKHPLEIAKKYEKVFFDDLRLLHILPPDTVARATETITEQIDIITILLEKNHAYITPQAIYFDTHSIDSYGTLSGQAIDEKKVGAREDVVSDGEKRHPSDFALWFFLVGKHENHTLHWPSPWGEGFPGWHLECSAISRSLLGQPLDIHAGGIDHLGTHHPNEIAQSEAAYDLPLAHTWIHGAFLTVDEGRMGKSEGNALTLRSVIEKGYDPLDLRYLFLTAHYRSPLSFSWDSLSAAQQAREHLVWFLSLIPLKKEKGEKGYKEQLASYADSFRCALGDDLNTPQALSVLWNALKDPLVPLHLRQRFISKSLAVLGIPTPKAKTSIPFRVRSYAKKREKLRSNKQFIQADVLRKKIDALGYIVEDTPRGPYFSPHHGKNTDHKNTTSR